MNHLPYFKPKSLVYTGKHEDIKTVIHYYAYSEKTFNQQDGFFKVPKDGEKSYIQVCGLTDTKTLNQLKDTFHIDPLVMEDILNVNQRIKIEYFESFIFATLSIKYLENDHVKSDYLSIYVTDQTVISFHETTPVYLNSLVMLMEEYMELKTHGSDMLFYHILDIITDHHLEVFDYLEAKTTAFEEEVLESKTLEQESFYLLRKWMLQLHGIVSPMFEQTDKMIQKKLPLLTEATNDYFNDLKDHLKRLDNKLFQSRDMMRQLLDLHMNNQSTKMNRIMSTLTLFSAIFIPLSFLTGFFGMNFHYFEALDFQYAIAVFIGCCILIAGGMLLFFKRRRWF